jgi:MFS family permease
MVTGPVLALLVYDLVIFLAAISNYKDAAQRRQLLLLCGLFFCSGMPALVYQIVWQRALFAIYGVNAESVAVVVSAFMLGLGLGSLVGGWVSARFPGRTMALFGAAELGVALFGICSLRIFHWVSLRTAGSSLPATVVLSLMLLIVPTMLMGATLPLLVEHLVRASKNVGASVATLYFVNTFGSAVVCYLCGVFLLRDFGQSGSVRLAAAVNAIVGTSALVFGLMQKTNAGVATGAADSDSGSSSLEGAPVGSEMSLRTAMWIAGLCGFIALGFEILWFRVFVLAGTDRAPMFALNCGRVFHRGQADRKKERRGNCTDHRRVDAGGGSGVGISGACGGIAQGHEHSVLVVGAFVFCGVGHARIGAAITVSIGSEG